MTAHRAGGLDALPALTREQGTRSMRIHALGLMDLPGLDDIASRIAGRLGEPYAMVNVITNVQTFPGLYSAPGRPEVGRTMRADHGFCPELLDRAHALVLPDVLAAPRFAGNAVVDQIGIRSYTGAPLIDPETGLALGTVCAVGTEPRDMASAQHSLLVIKQFQAEVNALIASIARTH